MKLTNLRKIPPHKFCPKSRPSPRYILNVDGKDIEFSFAQLFNHSLFRRRVALKLNFMPFPKPPSVWEEELRVLLRDVKDIPDPTQ